MAIHYNAFISYRHHPDDIRVATDIHRSLERFRVPKDIRKQGRQITRLFRDKDELPITSSLTDDIYEALENSDYLIVICSVHTKESIWVQREIETFLKTHHRSRVLTVLASGEPYEVIPEILLREQVADPITGQLNWVDIEPLSCDWRLPRKQAVREELPRLAAALLGCGYDALRQRQRQYRMRRLVVGFSTALAASLGLSAYFLHTSIRIQKANDELHAANEQIRQANVEIRKNLDQALRNQSEYLASVSQERMEAGDRLTAIALALEALPDQEGDRPYVASAEFALSDALNSYQSQTVISAVGALTADSAVNHFCVTGDGKRIYILDDRDIITVWDTETFQRTGQIDASEHAPAQIRTTPEGNVFFQTNHTDDLLLCYGPEGTLLWQVTDCVDAAFLDDRKTLMILQKYNPEDLRILFLDPETGAEQRPALEILPREDGAMIKSFGQDDFASGVSVTTIWFQGRENMVMKLDPDTGGLQELMRLDTSYESGGRDILAVSSVDDQTILMMVGDGTGKQNGNYGTFQIYSSSGAELICWDVASGEVRWKSRIVTYTFSHERTMERIPDSGNVLCQWGNTFQVHDAATGQVLLDCQTPAKPVTMLVDANGTWGVLENGQLFEFSFEDGQCITMPMMDGTVSSVQLKNGVFVLVPLSNQVQVYRNTRDDRGQALEGDYSLSVSTTLSQGTALAAHDSKELYLFDLASGELRWRQDSRYSHTILGFSGDGDRLWMWDSSGKCVLAFRTADGGQTTQEIPLENMEHFSSEVFFYEDSLLYVLTRDKQQRMVRMELSTGASESWQLGALEEEAYGNTIRILQTDGENIWFWKKDGTVNRLNTADGSVRTVLTEIVSSPVTLWNGKMDILAVASGHEMILLDGNGTERIRFSLEDRKGVSLYFRNQELLVLCDDGALYRYGLDGRMRSETYLSIYNTFSGKAGRAGEEALEIYWHETEDGALILDVFGAGNLIDCDQWQSRAFIEYMKEYIPESGQIIIITGGKIHAYRPYSTSEQMEYARKLLGEFELSEEKRQYYGVD